MASTNAYRVNNFKNISIILLVTYQIYLIPVNCISMKAATFSSLESFINSKRIDTDLIVENTNNVQLDCMLDCLNDVNCKSVGYHGDQNRCRLYSEIVSGSDGVAENGWIYYSIREDFCPTENFKHNRIVDVCYATPTGTKTCAQAVDICSSLSARLLTVDSQAKHDWAIDLCVTNNIDGTFFDAYLDSDGPAWKLWSTGLAPVYTYWDSGQPENIGACIGMLSYQGWRWHDYSSPKTTGIICEVRRP